jgi:hypothetical protein
MNPNYMKECTNIVGEHNKHENLIAIWDEPNQKGSTLKVKQNEIGFHLLIAMWIRFRPNIGA